MAKEFVNQHVVPEIYLLRFSEPKTHGKGGRIGAMRVDRNNKVHLFTTSISDVAYMKNYYDDPVRSDPKHWEHVFSQEYEPLYGKPLERILSRAILSVDNKGILNNADKQLIGELIIIQYLRVPDFLNRQQIAGEKIGADFAKELHQKFGKKLSSEKHDAIEMICNNSQIIKNITMGVATNKKQVDAYSKVIASNVMIILYNSTSIPFFTSDKPVILFNLKKLSMDYSDCGFARPDNIIIYPISPSILIQVYPRSMLYMGGMECDGSRIIITEKESSFVKAVNELQCIHAYREVFLPPKFLSQLNDGNENGR